MIFKPEDLRVQKWWNLLELAKICGLQHKRMAIFKMTSSEFLRTAKIHQDYRHRIDNKIKTFWLKSLPLQWLLSIMNHQSWGHLPGPLISLFAPENALPEEAPWIRKLYQKKVETMSNNNHSEFFAMTVVSESSILYIYICPIYIYTHYVLYIYSIVHTHHHGIVFSQQTFSTAAI